MGRGFGSGGGGLAQAGKEVGSGGRGGLVQLGRKFGSRGLVKVVVVGGGGWFRWGERGWFQVGDWLNPSYGKEK